MAENRAAMYHTIVLSVRVYANASSLPVSIMKPSSLVKQQLQRKRASLGLESNNQIRTLLCQVSGKVPDFHRRLPVRGSLCEITNLLSQNQLTIPPDLQKCLL